MTAINLIDDAWLQYRLDYQAAMHARDRDAAFAKADSDYQARLESLDSYYSHFLEEVKNEPL